VILGSRTAIGESVRRWGWRIPFLLSRAARRVVWIRLQLNESPLFQKMKAEGKHSKAPIARVLRPVDEPQDRDPRAARRAPPARPWSGTRAQFYALFFLTQTLKSTRHANILIALSLAHRHAVLHPVRLAVRQDRAQADHHGGLPARALDLLPDLQRAHRTSPTRR
jgi:hypothetical protein